MKEILEKHDITWKYNQFENCLVIYREGLLFDHFFMDGEYLSKLPSEEQELEEIVSSLKHEVSVMLDFKTLSFSDVEEFIKARLFYFEIYSEIMESKIK